MGFRFRKSIKVAPGIKMNLGKKSIGFSLGGKHGGVSFNTKTGARVRASLPGTGLSYSTSLSAGKKRSSPKRKPTPNPTYHYVTKVPNKKLSDYSQKSQNKFAVVYIVLGVLCFLMGIAAISSSILLGIIFILVGIFIFIMGVMILKKNNSNLKGTTIPYQNNYSVPPKQYNPPAVYVFITPTGKKYHKDPRCAGEKCIRVDINEAQSKGYTACSKCENSYFFR